MSWELKEHTHPVSSPGAWLVLWFASTLLGSVLGLVCLLVLPFGDLASILDCPCPHGVSGTHV